MPTFLLGLGALLGVLFFRPLWRSPEERLFEKQLEEVRTALVLVGVPAAQLTTMSWGKERPGPARAITVPVG